jgi:hypothetical protein
MTKSCGVVGRPLGCGPPYTSGDRHEILHSATLLRNVAFNPPNFSNVSSADANRLVVEAEQCFRCTRIPGLKAKIAQGLEVAGEELMARAVEIETMLQRRNRTNG